MRECRIIRFHISFCSRRQQGARLGEKGMVRKNSGMAAQGIASCLAIAGISVPKTFLLLV
jgi:hypothetical protein